MAIVKKYLAPAGAFLVLYLLFVVANAPAKKIIGHFKLPKTVHLGQISGSIFSGNVDSVYLGQHKIEDVRWSLSVLSLITFNPSADVEFGNPRLGYSGRFTASDLLSVASLQDVKISADADYIASKLNLMIDIKAAGQVQLDLPQYTPGKAVCNAATGVVNWQQAQLDATGEYVPLGDLAADISCEKGNVLLAVKPENNLGLQLDAIFNGRRLSATGFLQPGAKFPEQLQPMLGFMGKKDNQGRYRIRL
ncbi:type II secretion system protein N [Thalassotalea sp. Y01]|uniref:type II secretion system protein N n=1 Tax=Thalassotalea sp. Y01 TaxID=2729613 RepID=UPI00145CEC2D|nr:type II secretion system protein N [Thalassotalea sp. Y01]NMP17011.1 type II secretion system protein N [Thalassotalea sp. Y01]